MSQVTEKSTNVRARTQRVTRYYFY